MIIVALIGLKKCGKTTTAEALISEFKRRGFRVGGIKFMPNSRFTIDTPGKDTRRQMEAGADFVISLSKDEMAYIQKMERRAELKDALEVIPSNTDILICEGLNEYYPGILRVVLSRSQEQLEETMEIRKLRKDNNIIALSGIIANTLKEHPDYPVFNIMDSEGVKGLADLILEKALN